jgi:hypothetical protein
MASTSISLNRLNPADQDGYLRDIRALAAEIFRETDFHLPGMDVLYHRAIEMNLLESLLQWACEVDAAAVPAARAAFTDRLKPYLEAWQAMPPVRSLEFLALLCQLPVETFLETVRQVVTDPERPDRWYARFERCRDRSKQDVAGTLEGLRRRLVAYVADGAGTPSKG